MKTKMLLAGFLIAGIMAICLIFVSVSRESPQLTLAKEFLNKFFTVSNFNDPAISVSKPEKQYGEYLNERSMKQILMNRWGTLFGNVAAKDRCNIATESLVLEEYGSGGGRMTNKLTILKEYASDDTYMTRFNYYIKLKAFYPESHQEKVISLVGAINVIEVNGGYRIDYFKIVPLNFNELFAASE